MQPVNIRNALGFFVLATSVLQGCATTSSNENAAESVSAIARSSYVANTDSEVVMSNHDQCVRTISWSPEQTIVECNSSAQAETPSKVLVSYSGRAMFEFDSAQLTAAGLRDLDRLTAKLNSQDEIKQIEIVGHADSIGSDAYNQSLSERRSDSVKGYLQKALRTVAVSAKGMGERVPVADNGTDEGRALNRRVDVNIAANVEQ